MYFYNIPVLVISDDGYLSIQKVFSMANFMFFFVRVSGFSSLVTSRDLPRHSRRISHLRAYSPHFDILRVGDPLNSSC